MATDQQAMRSRPPPRLCPSAFHKSPGQLAAATPSLAARGCPSDDPRYWGGIVVFDLTAAPPVSVTQGVGDLTSALRREGVQILCRLIKNTLRDSRSVHPPAVPVPHSEVLLQNLHAGSLTCTDQLTPSCRVPLTSDHVCPLSLGCFLGFGWKCLFWPLPHQRYTILRLRPQPNRSPELRSPDSLSDATEKRTVQSRIFQE